MNYSEFQRAEIRLAILQCLEAAAQFRAGERLLTAFCSGIGLTVSSDAITTQADWLVEQGLAQVAQAQPVRVIAITSRGLDVATGKAIVSGVNRPQV